MHKYKKHLIVLLLLNLLSGCYKPINSLPSINPLISNGALGAGAGALIAVAGSVSAGAGAGVGLVMGSMIGDSMRRYTPKFELSQQQLRSAGVEVLRIGEEQKLIIPAGQLFYDHSPRLRPDAYTLLHNVLCYMQQYRFIGVAVDGYTGLNGPVKRNLALSQQRAQNIADYLWHAKLDNRLITANGLGSAEPIASNSTRLGQMLNERIEVHFRVLRG